ncbi:tRNA (guanine-N(7)-)-methyltransferase [uncultured Woeseiaceae bacterium]|uniref:tRNA (guanine-N(7)-)-methyltransferase n=1 Tax=uncultured Woeseiaceae bacterium TaxID=1983305 RepID=A0A7D9D278_9GAMM|nr:tRNA (guanine-N(7)-)-methyltransferase [uncultured Woeseiaceae bacterium]
MSGRDSQRRTVRSFVRRSGRITPAQERALKELWPRYGLDFSTDVLHLDQVFGRSAERVLEIGFGNGETLVRESVENPGTDYIGVEVYEPGIGHCLIDARDAGLTNLRIIRRDALEVLQYQIGDGALVRINLLFPDPWPKKRHHKRRIVQAPFLRLAARKLAVAGMLQIATDWENYAEHIDALIAAYPIFSLAERRKHSGEYGALERETTKFERRGLREGHSIWDWRLIRN